MSTSSLTIITGASRGMGRAMAEQLLQPGATVVGIARQADDALARQAEAAGATLLQWQEDLVEAAPAAQRLAAWLGAQEPGRFGTATLINNAGVIPDIAPLRDVPEAGIARALRVGLEAPMLLAGAFLRATQHWDGVPRKVLNISSGLGRRALASQAGYCAAKAGMDHFTRCLALEEALQPNGARVCSLAPGVIDTAMQVQLRSAPDADFPGRSNFEALKAQGQLSTPADAAARILAYLARPDFGDEPVADVRG